MVEILCGINEEERRRGDAMVAENFFRACLIEAERERERIAPRVWKTEELADCRDVRFPIHAVESLGDVEDEIRLLMAHLRREVGGCLESNDVTVCAQSARDRVDRRSGIPFGV